MAILSESDFAQILTAAISAPSGGNMQPWLIKRRGDSIILSINHARSHNLLDVDGAAAIFSLGMLAENLVIMSGSLGYLPTLEFSKDDDHQRGNLVVTVTYTGKSQAGKTDSDLARAIKQRCTNRRLHVGAPITEQIIQSLGEHFADSGIRIAFLDKETSKREVCEALATNDVLRLRHRASLGQLLREIRWSEQEALSKRDGIDLKTLEFSKTGEQFLRLLHRMPKSVFLLPSAFLKRFTAPPILGSSHLGLVSLESAYSDRSMFQAGRYTQRLWLKSTLEKISLQPYTVLTFNLLRVLLAAGEGFSSGEQAMIRADASDVSRIFGMPDTAVPVFIFRLARAPDPQAKSLRLPEQSFLV
jgi:nitroreductase